LRVPKQWIAALRHQGSIVVIGPHGSVTPRATIEKTGADVVMRGEPDQTLPQLASLPWEMVAGCCWRDAKTGSFRMGQGLGVVDMQAVPMLDYSDYPIERHTPLHHVFPGNGADHLRRWAEVEFARGCPYACTFCNKTLFRNKYRERKLDAVLGEIDQLIARGVDYVYFIDEIFGVGRQVRVLLEEIAKRPISIGFQTRIDLWDESSIDLLGRAHCVSFECGIESITDEGREAMNKNCRIETERITQLLKYARQRIPWVQANLIKVPEDDPAQVMAWQAELKAHGVWVSEPVPMFPFPGSPEYVTTFSAQPDEQAWERAHAHYLAQFAGKGWSDIQEQRPLALEELEREDLVCASC
jgi:B12-binding domain/radical SAM domain protein of rhizo-twelve system